MTPTSEEMPSPQKNELRSNRPFVNRARFIGEELGDRGGSGGGVGW